MISKKLEIVAHIHCVRRYISNKFVPKHQSVGPDDVQKLENFIRNKQNVLVLTGAGISTESGDYSNSYILIFFWLFIFFYMFQPVFNPISIPMSFYSQLKVFQTIVLKVLASMHEAIHDQCNI